MKRMYFRKPVTGNFQNRKLHLSRCILQDRRAEMKGISEEELMIDIIPFDFQDEMTSLKFYEELLAGINKENIHSEMDTGPAMGNEIW
jgi:hypothetical protein